MGLPLMLRWLWPLPKRRWPVAAAVVAAAVGCGWLGMCVSGPALALFGHIAIVVLVVGALGVRSWRSARRQAREALAARDRTDELLLTHRLPPRAVDVVRPVRAGPASDGERHTAMVE